MSQVTDPVLLDSTGQNIVAGISAVVSAIQSRGMPSPSTSNPQMDSTASSGTSNDYARGDHVHPENPANAKTAQLAYVETGTTASRNYTAGQYISLNGLLYTADTAIAIGATFYTSGGNKNLTDCVGGGFNTLNAVAAKVTPFDVASNSYVDVSIGYGIIFCGRSVNGQYLTRVLFEIIAGGNPFTLMDIGTQTGRVTATKQSTGVVRISSSSTVTTNCIAIGI